jgi:hypothetical protein
VSCRPIRGRRGQSDDKSDDNDTSDEGGQGRSETARRGSLDGPGNAIVTMEEEARQGFLGDNHALRRHAPNRGWR